MYMGALGVRERFLLEAQTEWRKRTVMMEQLGRYVGKKQTSR